jgi:hypothetical protein
MQGSDGVPVEKRDEKVWEGEDEGGLVLKAGKEREWGMVSLTLSFLRPPSISASIRAS